MDRRHAERRDDNQMTVNRTKVVSPDSYDSYDGHSRMTPFRDPMVASFPAKIGPNRAIEYRSEGDHNLQTESNGNDAGTSSQDQIEDWLRSSFVYCIIIHSDAN
eukprot:scaffold162830_cov52-Attheya_sp.AAC.6